VNPPYKVEKLTKVIKQEVKPTYKEELQQLDFRTFEERKIVLVK